MKHEIIARTPERTYVPPHPALRTAISHYTIFNRCAASLRDGSGERCPIFTMRNSSC